MAEYMHQPAPTSMPSHKHRPPPTAPDPAPAEVGQKGHIRAVWRHKLGKRELAALSAADFPRLCIHGRHDLIAEVQALLCPQNCG